VVKAYFISDIHLKALNERNGILLINFLRRIKNDCSHLFLLGDIFDFWVGDHDYYFSKFREINEALVDVKLAGCQVHYCEGNHDVHVKRFWEERFGISCFIEPQTFSVGPWKIRCEHGDYINPKDTTYLRYREFIRTPFMQKVAQILPAKKFNLIGDQASRWSRSRSSKVRVRDSELLRSMIRAYAQQVYQNESFDFLITGHMHIRDEFELSGSQKAYSINLGSWFDEPMALIVEAHGHRWEKIELV
jgi:UDP-2,3-diacylglucosamine hydrolase